MTEASSAGSAPVHRRTVVIDVVDAGDDRLDVVGRLHDERPWAAEETDLPVVHDLELRVGVSRTDFVVRSVHVEFRAYPHAECPQIAPAYEALVGVPLGRGWQAAVRERLGGPAGCTHLRELARAMAPVIVQAAFSAQVRAAVDQPPAEQDEDASRLLLPLVANTCHVWASGGAAEKKLLHGWRPGTTPTPVPPVSAFEP